MKSYRLSKSKFVSASQCEKKLWLEIHDNDKSSVITESQESVFDQGYKVGEIAQTYFPNGVLIKSDYLDIPQSIKNTFDVINNKSHSIYEGFFQYNDVLVIPDILKNNNDGSWDLIEVKSSTKVKPENITDIAIQAYVLEGLNININKFSLMHINNECIYPDLSNLFTLVDLSNQISPLLSNMNSNLENLQKMLNKPEPNTSIGSHCSKPYNCDFKDYCWDHIPEYSIFNIPGMFLKKKEDLYNNAIVRLNDLPDNYKLKSNEKKFVDSYLTKLPILDKNSIRYELDSLVYPLYFLDFETYGSAIPEFDGMKPYSQYPFQFSCHILDNNNNLSHIEYLHSDNSDPRDPLVNKLIDTCGKNGTIVSYNAPFEKGVINKLSQQFPDYKFQLDLINNRFWDQLFIFRNFYTDYRFKGSNSIKSVLPVLVPNLNYSDLNIQDGIQAQIGWKEMISLDKGKPKDKLFQQLLEYCRLDTLAMVEIHKFLDKI